MRLESRRFRIPNTLSHGALGQVVQRWALNGDRDVIEDRRARLLPALNKFDAVIAPSRFLADRFAPFVDTGRLHCLAYGLDLASFAANHPVAAPGGALRIGFIGQIAPHKGVHLLIQAFQHIQPKGRPIELNVYGGLESQPRYVTQLRRLAGGDRRIRFHGRVENSRIAQVLAGLDVAVTPSTWYENSPLVIHEAHAAGVPVIASALGGMAELVRDGVDGLHFRPNDAADLARKLQQLIDQPDLLRRLRAGVKPPIGIDEEMEQLTALYRRLIASRSSESA
jgi:glycosyltransferase involved in cell wall biosynthesis